MARGVRWTDRLAAAVKRGKFTTEDKNLAGNWVSCAVGEAPRSVTKVTVRFDPKGTRPEDNDLEELGMQFYEAVRDQHVGEAVDTYHSIRARVRALKEVRR